MNAPFRWVALAVLALPALGHACRCEQRTLAEYFAAADTVLFARAVATNELSERRSIAFELLVPSYKGADNAVTGDTLTFSTAKSSASCGIEADIGAVYVVFARTQDGDEQQWVDYCSGTRVQLSENVAEPQGFVDVPARFVASQLNGLAGMVVLRDVAANAPNENDADNEHLIGLLAIPALADGGEIAVFVDTDADTPPVAQLTDMNAVEFREYSYEQPGAVVYTQEPGWYRIRLASGQFGWLRAADSGSYFPYRDLPPDRLSYLNQHWSGFVWPEAGAGLPQRSLLATADAAEIPVNVIESKLIGGMPWFRVEIYADEICTGTEPSVAISGWVPGYGRSGEPSLWFYSRGC